MSVGRRSLFRDFQHWSVRELDGHLVPGSRGAAYLIFETAEVVRRLWVFPSNWRQLDDEALWRVSQVFPPAATDAATDGQLLRSVFIASMLSERRASALVARARTAVQASQALRQQRKALLQECRASRLELHESVSAFARRARDAGSSAGETLLALESSVRDTAFVMQDTPRTDRLARDVARWCALEFRAA